MFDSLSPNSHLSNRNQAAEPEFLNAEQAAAFLHMELSTLYKYTSQRLVPHFKRSGKLLFDRSELSDWLLEGRRPVINGHSATEHLDKVRGGGR